MKHTAGETAGPDGRKKMAALAAFLLLFPSSASVLCVTPGGHVAIEELNATCCASSILPTPARHLPNNGLSPEGGCSDCTDFFMTPNGRGALLVSSGYADPVSIPGEHPDNLPSIDLSIRLGGAVDDADAPAHVSNSLPLRR